MYGVLVVSVDDTEDNDELLMGKQQLGYLKAYSGIMPRPQYGGSNINKEKNDNRFVPLVYDGFTKSTTTTSSSVDDDGDHQRFDYENEQESLKSLTKEIEEFENCPKRLEDQKQLKDMEIELYNQLLEAKKEQKVNKRNRKQRRDQFRQKLIAIIEQQQQRYSNNSNRNNNKNENNYNNDTNSKDLHKYFLENDQGYRLLEDQLVEESTCDQRQFKTIKRDVQNKLVEITK